MADASKGKPVAAVIGVGPGLGAALARRFARDYVVAVSARSADYLKSLGGEIKALGGSSFEVPADVSDRAQVAAAFKSIRENVGSPDVLIYNAGVGPLGSLSDISADEYEHSWRVNSLGAFLSAKEVVPAMIERGRGVLLFTGATAGIKAGARSTAFGPAKFASRGLAQSLARDLGPKGIHVAWINVDGIIDIPRTRERMPQFKDEDLLKPDAIAETYWHVAHQDPSAWTLELEVRPFKEKF
jgi:NAD(P)-dependent dehydrogenase (short-subunit alcohol dehydrogenase family)